MNWQNINDNDIRIDVLRHYHLPILRDVVHLTSLLGISPELEKFF